MVTTSPQELGGAVSLDANENHTTCGAVCTTCFRALQRRRLIRFCLQRKVTSAENGGHLLNKAQAKSDHRLIVYILWHKKLSQQFLGLINSISGVVQKTDAAFLYLPGKRIRNE